MSRKETNPPTNPVQKIYSITFTISGKEEPFKIREACAFLRELGAGEKRRPLYIRLRDDAPSLAVDEKRLEKFATNEDKTFLIGDEPKLFERIFKHSLGRVGPDRVMEAFAKIRNLPMTEKGLLHDLWYGEPDASRADRTATESLAGHYLVIRYIREPQELALHHLQIGPPSEFGIADFTTRGASAGNNEAKLVKGHLFVNGENAYSVGRLYSDRVPGGPQRDLRTAILNWNGRYTDPTTQERYGPIDMYGIRLGLDRAERRPIAYLTWFSRIAPDQVEYAKSRFVVDIKLGAKATPKDQAILKELDEFLDGQLDAIRKWLVSGQPVRLPDSHAMQPPAPKAKAPHAGSES